MSVRNYTARVMVQVFSPEGKLIGTSSDEATLEVDMRDFKENAVDADKYMTEEMNVLSAAAIHNVSECFK